MMLQSTTTDFNGRYIHSNQTTVFFEFVHWMWIVENLQQKAVFLYSRLYLRQQIEQTCIIPFIF